MNERKQRIRELHAARPTRNAFWLSLGGLLLLSCVSWWQLAPDPVDLVSPRRLTNLQRFAREIYPVELRDKPFGWTPMLAWVADVWQSKGATATAATLQISVIAIVLAGALSCVFLWPASRNVATGHPFEQPSQATGGQPGWHVVTACCRGLFVLARALPEYVLAFLFIAILGPSVWPAILALAIHNFGILGRLGAEVVENIDPTRPRALRAQGLSRAQIALASIVPESLTRWLLFFFYRWESCIRESTVVGMLGIASIGFWIRETRAHDRYDELLWFIVFGAGLVIVGDILSALTRRNLRRAS